MTEKTIPVKGVAYTFTTTLISQSNTKLFVDTPTIEAGDIKVKTDSGALSNIESLPTVSGMLITIDLSATEMNGDLIKIIFHDAIGDQWCDQFVELRPSLISFKDICSNGGGSIAYTYPVTLADNITPIPDVAVYVTTDSNGATILASGITDANGNVVFHLNPGSYYFWSYKVGFTFTNPDLETVS